MSSSNPNEANNFLQKTIKLKTRTLKPYEKKFVKKGEFRLWKTSFFLADTPLQHISQHSLYVPADTCSQPSEDMPRTALSGQNVAMSTEETENEAFLNADEIYIHLLKVENVISIFPGVNGPGSVLVFKDFCQEKQKLLKEKWILVERKCVSFNSGQFCWIYWCSCNEMITRQISSLDSVLNSSKEDFIEQYPDCFHLTAARKIFENYDHINSIVPSSDINCRRDQDHENYTTRNILYEVPDSKLYFMDEITVRNEEQKQSYQPKLLSYNKISYNVTEQLTEGLHQLKNENNFTLLIPEETTCRHCGNDLADGDPIENGWVAYESAVIVTNTNISYAKAYYRPCTSCESVSFFEGQSKCLLNCGTFLVGYDVLRSYMYSFLHGRRPLHTFYETFCDIHIDYGNSTIRDVFSYQRLRYSWLYFMDLLDIDFTEGFSCPECGGDDGEPPTMLICDGTSISFQRRMWQWDDLKSEPFKKLNISGFKDKVFIADPHTRKLLQRFAAGGQYVRGKKLKPLEKNEKEKLFLDIKKISLPLFEILKEIEAQPDVAYSYRKFFLSLASPSPVCSYVHATKEVQNVLTEIFKEVEVRQNPNLIDQIHKYIPIIFDIIEVGSISNSLKLLLKEMWDIAIVPFIDSLEDIETQEVITTEEMSLFPSLPKIRNRGLFEQDKKNMKNTKDTQDCSKTYRGHPSLLPGIFTIFCPHGVCYGFQVMQTNESPDVPFTIFRTRFKTAPKYIIYDNACKLHAYCISRNPQFFKDTEFYVDRLHWENHTSCSYGYNLSLYLQFSNVNSQLSEHSNAGLKRIKNQLSYMTANNFMKHCTFYLWKKNRDKLKIS